MSGKILIVDGLVTNRIVLKVKLDAACHQVLQAATGAEALRVAADSAPRLILMDMRLPDMTGIEACRRLRAEAGADRVPIVLIGGAADRDLRLAALEAGADDVLAKPLHEGVLLARIRSLLRARQADLDLQLRAETCRDFGLAEAAEPFDLPARVALVAPDAAMAIGWRAELRPHLGGDYHLVTASAALAGAGQPGAPDLYVIAADLDRPGDGIHLIADLRARIGGQHAGLCLALPQPWADGAALALDLGANDLVPLPLDGPETAVRLRQMLIRQRRAEGLRRAVHDGLQLAATDPLTGLWNRRYALAHLDRIADRAQACGACFAVMVLDLDRFKAVNDRFGHASGDAVLRAVAARLQAALRPSDLLARIGGEEFLAVLPEVSLEVARGVAERLCRAVAAAPIALPDHPEGVRVTLSAGLALVAPDDPSAGAPPAAEPGAGGGGDAGRHAARGLAQAALGRADAALFAAKGEGRNQVTVATAA